MRPQNLHIEEVVEADSMSLIFRFACRGREIVIGGSLVEKGCSL